MKFGLRRVTVVALAVVLLATACGDEEAGSPASTDSFSPAETTTTTSVAPADIGDYEWSLVADGAPWGGRAGLRDGPAQHACRRMGLDESWVRRGFANRLG